MDKTGLGNLMANPFAGDSKKTGGLKLTLDDKAMKSVMQGVEKSLPKTANLTKEIGNIGNGIGNIVSGIEGLGIELPEEIKGVVGGIQSLITIASGISTILIAIEALTAADSFIPFANGGVVPHAANGFAGMVPGNHYSGDVTPIMANAGEVVLNRAQAGVIANQLEAGGQQGGYTPSHVSGEQIWIALNAYTRRTGKGELVTWR
jgi:hypothetical protein